MPATQHVANSKSKDREVRAAALALVDDGGNRGPSSRDKILSAAFLFLSGEAALIYQILWIKQLSLVVGIDVYSITIAVSTFFAGLAAGSVVFGQWADRLKNPIRLYAALEGATAITGVGTTVALAHSAGTFAWLVERVGLLAWLLPFVLVGVPAFLMGGALPVLARALIVGQRSLSSTGGFLYAANTAGGIVGVLASSFLLIPLFGVWRTSIVSAGLNLTASLGAPLLLKSSAKAPDVRPTITLSPNANRSALTLYGISGGIALGYEIVWSQAIAQFTSTRVFAFSIVLAVYLGGIFLGSLLASRYVDQVRDKWGAFAVLISAAGVVALIEVAALGKWQFYLQSTLGNAIGGVTKNFLVDMCVRFAVAALGIVFMPTVLLGAAFPFVLSLCRNRDGTSHEIGAVLGWNTVGGVVGTLITGFLLVPRFGLVLSLVILAVAAMLVASLAIRRSVERAMVWTTALLGCVFILTAILVPSSKFAYLFAQEHGGVLRFYEESRGGTVAVIDQIAGSNSFRRLYIQGVSNSGDAITSQRYMRLQALLPLILHKDRPRSALVIGLGTGITAGALTQYPGLTEIKCAELLPAVVRASSRFSGNYDVASNRSVKISLRDGRQELLRNDHRYDLVTLEPPPPSAAGVANLYSVEFYRLAAKRLNQGGMLAQWLPLATQNDNDTKALIRSFVDVFPYASLWTTELHEMLLLGSFDAVPLDFAQISERYNYTGVAEALAAVGVTSPEALMALWVIDRDGLLHYTSGVVPVIDDRPSIEYSKWVRPREILRTLPELLELRKDPPLVGSDENMWLKVRAERDGLDDFYAAGLAAYAGDRQEWAKRMKNVMRQNGKNPYYRWIVGE